MGAVIVLLIHYATVPCRYYNMRIITIRRNCQFLKQTLLASTEQNITALTNEIEKMVAIIKKIQAFVDVVTLRKNGTGVQVCNFKNTTLDKRLILPLLGNGTE